MCFCSLGLVFSTPRQEIGLGKRLRNDLFCVEWDVKPQLSQSVNASNTHTHTHPFNGPFSGTTQVSRYQKGKTSLDFIEARDSEWQWHQLGHMKVCMSLQTDNHAITPSLNASNNNLLIMMTSQVAIDTKYLCLQHSSVTLVDDSSTYDSITNIFVGHFLTVINLENFVLRQALYSFSETCELFVSQETAIIIHNNSTLAIWPQV